MPMAKSAAFERAQEILGEGFFFPKSAPLGQKLSPHLNENAVPATISLSANSGLTVRLSLPGGEEMNVRAEPRRIPDGPLRPVSFGTQPYDGEGPNGRYTLEPVAGEQHLDPEKALGCPPGYLFQELNDRLARGPIEFRWRFAPGGNGDHASVDLGTLSVQKLKA